MQAENGGACDDGVWAVGVPSGADRSHVTSYLFAFHINHASTKILAPLYDWQRPTRGGSGGGATRTWTNFMIPIRVRFDTTMTDGRTDSQNCR